MVKNKIGLIGFLKEVWKELFDRCVWPTREEVFLKTIVVIVLLAIVATILGFVDYLITFLTSVLLQGEFVSVLLSSRITLFVVLGVVFLFLFFLAIRYMRRNRYNR